MATLLHCLITLSEKAAHLARIIRSEKALFELLVEEKKGEQKNKRFVRDFKTLGDVLIQEMIQHDITQKFPNLKDYIFGEESNKFTNTLGESITVAVQDTKEQTCALLTKVLDGNQDAALLLANTVHQDDVAMPTDLQLDDLDADINIDMLGIWIDPIDGTAQYIKGEGNELPKDGIHEEGLQCAIVLIGVFDRDSGEPVMGIINQPFHRVDHDNGWKGRHLWGISCASVKANSLQISTADGQAKPGVSVVASRSENVNIKAMLDRLTDGKIRYACGAGYKSLCAIECCVDAYVLSAGSTFKWDTCGPHAILKSMNGGIVDLCRALEMYRKYKAKQSQGDGELGKGSSADSAGLDLALAELRYDRPDPSTSCSDPGQKWANTGGMVAYRSKDALLKILQALSVHPDL